jgi:thymidylate synthase ThyX
LKKGGENLEQQTPFFNEASEDTQRSGDFEQACTSGTHEKGSDRGHDRLQAAAMDQNEMRSADAPHDLLKPFITNPDGNVYAVTNLPEEFVAVLFAWVSRSPKSFKEHLLQAIQDGHIDINEYANRSSHQVLSDKAAAFHEKWTVGYGHSCYDEETDVLTRNGFKRWSEVTVNDELASVDPDTMEIEYLKPIKLISEPYNGPMYKVDRNRIDMLVTPNHRLFAWPRHLVGEFVTRKYQLIPAELLKDKCYKVKLGGLKWNGDVIDTLYGYPAKPLLKLFGFFIGDGYIEEHMRNAIQFHLRKSRKIEFLYELCSELGLNLSANKGGKFYITGENHHGSIGDLMAKCYDEHREKQIPQELFDLDASLLMYLYDGLLNSDGSVGKTGEVYDTTSVKLVDQIQHLCTLLGWTSSTKILHPSESENHKDRWRIFVNKKLLESMINKVQYDIFDEWVEYSGMVYCAELPKYHTLIVRRNGRIHVSGNSVAEHAIAHVGIEKISRLASAELELSNEFYSITEYSQRYQKPVRGGWHNPGVGREHEMLESFFHECYTVFEQLIAGVHKHLMKKTVPPESQKELDKINAANMKLAFEDARYALPLAMYTQLGMTANGRAWRDGIVNLYSSRFKEVRDLADNLKTEITKVLPTLIKYANPSQYHKNSKLRLKHNFGNTAKAGMHADSTARLITFPSEKEALELIHALMYVQEEGMSYEEAIVRSRSASSDRLLQVFNDLMFELGTHDNPPEVLKQLDYRASLLVSEANWHQLLRHNRKTNFIFNEPNPFNGITIPPRIKEAGLEHLLFDLARKSEALYNELSSEIAPYVVLNAHRRRIIAHFDLWEAYHLINLRTSTEAQWDIRQTFTDLYNQLLVVNPNLFQYAKRR